MRNIVYAYQCIMYRKLIYTSNEINEQDVCFFFPIDCEVD